MCKQFAGHDLHRGWARTCYGEEGHPRRIQDTCRPGDVTVPLWRRGPAWPLTLLSPVLSPSTTCRVLTPVSTTLRPRSTSITMLISKTPSMSSLLWCLNPQEVLMKRVSLYSASCSALLRNLQSSVAQAVLNRVGGSGALSFDDSLSDHVCGGDCDHRHFYLTHD